MTENPPKRRPGPRGRRADLRARALQAGVDLFMEHGFDNTSMSAIAALAGISKATLYAHFQDKTRLFDAVLEERGRALDLALDTALPPSASSTEEKLTAVVVAILRETTSESSLSFLRSVVTESVRRPELTAIPGAREMPHAVEVVAAALEADAARLGYALDDAGALALMFLRMSVASLQFDALSSARFRPGERLIAAHARWATEIFLRAVRSVDANGDRRAPMPPEDYRYDWTPER